ncbi:MAG: efflux transporter outer membrane subunit [Planctomycetota bacterium]|nr:efflux transporter outer membrane subunit [Planctomycetota bacterium]
MTRALLALSLASLAGACAPVGPNYERPAVRTPASFASLAPDEGVATSGRDTAIATWWRVFDDPVLDRLIARAVAGNHDVRIAAARVREARALRGAADSTLLPSVDAAGGFSRSQRSGTIANAFGSDEPNSLWRAGLDVSWELDIFGGRRRAIEALDRDLEATEEARRDVLVTLTSEVARTYVELRSLQQRLEVGERAVVAQSETLDLTASRARAGIAPDIETEQARAQLANRQGQLPPIRAEIRRATFRLGVLLGQSPDALLDELRAPAAIPTPPASVPVGLPSDLLRRRPDIRQAERQLAASVSRVGVETAALYPSFSLTGAGGVESADLATLFDSSSRFWSIGPSVRWRVFDRREIRQRIAAADARSEQALLAYERSVLLALEEVEASLTDLAQQQDRRRFLAQAVDAGRRAVDLSTQRYQSGVGDFLSVLVNQRDLYDAEDQLVQSELGVTRSLVLVYKALGGGWEDDPNTSAGQTTPSDADAPPQDPAAAPPADESSRSTTSPS